MALRTVTDSPIRINQQNQWCSQMQSLELCWVKWCCRLFNWPRKSTVAVPLKDSGRLLCQSVFNWLGWNCVPVALNACLLPLELTGPHRSSPYSSLNCLHCSLSPSSHSLFYTCLSHSGFECHLPALQMPSSLSEMLFLQLIPPSLSFRLCLESHTILFLQCVYSIQVFWCVNCAV